jgi:micrococcal nuclease
MYEYRAKVENVYDGDTITVSVVLGFGVYKTEKLRLSGINAPELRGDERPYGLVSRDKLRELIQGQEIIIKTFKDKKGKYGRYIADIYLDNPETGLFCINDWLVENKLAVYKQY